jgi:two-component system response regulator YesN
MKLLLVDDEIIVRRGLKVMVQKAGFPFEEILEAANGQEAVKIVECHKPEIILLDIKMPGLDGISAAKEIRKIAPQARVIFLTAYAQFHYAQGALRCKASDYLVKPVKPEELKLTISNCIEELYPQLSLSHSRQLIKRAITYILDNIQNQITLDDVADQVHLSPAYFSSLFRKETGRTFSDFLIEIRIEQAKNFLKNSPALSIFEISERIGYPDANYFSRVFRKKTGISPSAYRRNAAE